MFATVGSDGVRCVVWGLGVTPEEALTDAAQEANNDPPEIIGTIEIGDERATLVREGHVGADDLVERWLSGVGIEGLRIQRCNRRR